MTEETLQETLERNWDALVRYDEELNGTSDRATAILAAAYFEDKLGDAIMRRFAQLSSAFADQVELRNRVFKNVDPIRNFSAKIEIGFAIGLYNDGIRKKLRKVGEIRNEFAHTSKPVEFDDAEIASKCCQLETCILPDSDTSRSRYITFLKEVEKHIQCPTAISRGPRILTATAGDAQVDLEWILPSETLTQVQVRWKKAADMPFGAADNWTNLCATATKYKVTNLENGTDYTFAVRTENSTGPSETTNRSATPKAACAQSPRL